MIRRAISATVIWLALAGMLVAQGWIPLAAVAPATPAFSFNFAAVSSLPANMSFARTGTATYFDINGNLATAATNTARFGYDFFSHQPIGLIVEPSPFAFAIRNNSWQGASAGTPGTAPTNWTITCNGNGLSTSIANPGSLQNNIDYGDIRIFGTTGSTAECDIFYEVSNFQASSNNDSWVHSSFLQLIGGTNANISTIEQDIGMYTAANAFIAFRGSGQNLFSSLSPTAFLRPNDRLLVNQATTGFVTPVLRVIPSGSGVAVDITIRIGLPQLEFGSSATSVVRSTGATVSRAADVPQFTGSPATIIGGASYSVVGEWNNTVAGGAFALIGAKTANYAGLGWNGSQYTTSNGNGVSQLSVASTVPVCCQYQQQTIGVSVGGANRLLTSMGGTLRGGATGSDSTNIGIGPFVGTGNSSGFSINANGLRRVDIYSVPLTQAQLEAKTNPIETTEWGNSYTQGTGSLGGYGYVGWLNALSQAPYNRQGFAGQTTDQIIAIMLADTAHVCDNVVFETGRNNVSSNTTDFIAQNVAAVAHLQTCPGGNNRYIFATVVNTTAENSASSGGNLANYNGILAMNAALQANFPGHVADVRAAIVSASGGSNDAPAATYMFQGSVHPNDAGYQIYATTIYNLAHSSGWLGY